MSNWIQRVMRLSAVLSMVALLLAACGSSAAARPPSGTAAGGMSAIGATSGAGMGMAMDSAPHGAVTVAPSATTAVKQAPAVKTAPHEIAIDNFRFSPQTLTVSAGTTVTWVNHDDVPHTVTSTDHIFGSGALDTDDHFTFTFNVPGTYAYFCSIHPQMTATVIVK